LPKKDKTAAIDTVCELNSWTRKHAISKINAALIKTPNNKAKEPATRTKKYEPKIVLPLLRKIWMLSGMQNSKALHGLIECWYDRLERFGELKDLDPTPEKRQLIINMSESTMDRMLKQIKDSMKLKGKSTTKAGTMHRNSITIRKAGYELEIVPGFVEVDTVAHCGATLKGEFIRTITMTDVFTG
jgi:hypothetical protein